MWLYLQLLKRCSYGDVSDPRAGSTRGFAKQRDALERKTPATGLVQQRSEATAASKWPEVRCVGEVLQQRKEDLERQLAVVNRMLALSRRPGGELTMDELRDLWQSL